MSYNFRTVEREKKNTGFMIFQRALVWSESNALRPEFKCCLPIPFSVKIPVPTMRKHTLTHALTHTHTHKKHPPHTYTNTHARIQTLTHAYKHSRTQTHTNMQTQTHIWINSAFFLFTVLSKLLAYKVLLPNKSMICHLSQFILIQLRWRNASIKINK